MSQEYILNRTLEVIPLGPDIFELRLPVWGSRLIASQFQVGVLQHFEQWANNDEILARFPFKKEETADFVRRCIDEGFLLGRLPSGEPRFPGRIRPQNPIFGAPVHRADEPAGFTILGIPLDTNTTGAPGARFGPNSVRTAASGTRYSLDSNTMTPRGFMDFSSGRRLLEGVPLSDAGDVYLATGESPEVTYDRITEVVTELLDSGTVPFVLGGDHSITYPVLRAFPCERLRILHLDAHTDLGDVDGAGLHHANVFTVVLDRLEFVEHIYQVGLRGVVDLAEEHDHPKVTPIGMDQFRTKGADALIKTLPTDAPYYVSIDVDVLDPAFAPATGTPVTGGLYPHEFKAFLRKFAESREIVGVDFVEIGAPLYSADATSNLVIEGLLTIADAMVNRLQATEG